MNPSGYNSTEYIMRTRDNINNLLKPLNNEVYVFDFGHYILKNAEKHSYYFKSVISGSESYKNQLFPNNKIKTDSNTYTYFETNLKQIKNIPPSFNLTNGESQKTINIFKLGPEIIVADTKFAINDWINELINISVNGCLFVFAKKVGNYQSGVWLVLKNRIDLLNDDLICLGFKNDCAKCYEKNNNRKCIYDNNKNYFQDKLDLKSVINEIFQELDNLLINELVFNAEEYTKQIEAQRLAFEKFNKEILQAHSHTIFNCIPILDVQNLRDKLTSLLAYYSNAESEENKDLTNIDEELKMLHIRLNELNYVTHAALESPFSNKEKLFKQQNLKQLIGILTELTKDKCNPSITGLDVVSYNPSFKDKDCQNAFTILWNAWNNAVKHSPNKSFDLNLTETPDDLCIEFINYYEGILNKENISMLNNKYDPQIYAAGIPIIKHLCNILDWVTGADDSNNTFRLILKIKKHNYDK